MSIEDNGGTAFPAQFWDERATGMTLRDYFAAKALQGMLANSTEGGNELEYAVAAYRFANAMLEARKQ